MRREGVPADAKGRIPFRIRIGVVGHRELEEEAPLSDAVRDQVRAVLDERLGLPKESSTPLKLAVVSPLAEGADRIVVREVLAEAASRSDEARLEVILPMEREEYSADQGFSGPVLNEYGELLEEATLVTELAEGRAASRYRHAGHAIVNRCDVLLALWSGEPSGGEGGSAETLLYAAARWRPCIWIQTTDPRQIRHNLEPGSAKGFLEEVQRRAGVVGERATIGEPREAEPDSVLGSLTETYGWFCRLNGEPLPPDFPSRVDEELHSSSRDLDWLAAPYLRAGLAADRSQRQFTWATWGMAGIAFLIATTVGISLSFGWGPAAVRAWLEFSLVLILLGVFVYTHSRLQLHERWLSYRLLSERLRSARYLAATGINFARVVERRSVFVEQQSANWLQRAFEETWDSRPHAGSAHRITEEEVDALKTLLADDWILPQINYHRRAAERHEQKQRFFARVISALFVVTLALVLARGMLETVDTVPEVVDHLSVFLSIVLPAVAASLGAVLTVRQHRALAERSHRMEAELVEVRARVVESDADSLQRVSSDAARVIAEESGDWFGAMWFLDIEHPP